MREYQAIKNNPYLLPHHLYMRMLYTIRDYYRLKEKTNQTAINETQAIESALRQIPMFYREAVFENIVYGSRYPMGADERTFRRYKQRYIYNVARLLNCV